MSFTIFFLNCVTPKRLQEFNLVVTSRGATELRSIRTSLAEQPQNATLDEPMASRIRDEMQDLQRTLRAEAGGNYAYIITEKRLDVVKLMERPAALFRPGVFERLPQVAQYDFAEAGKCVAFERSTAGAFHVLRGTEDVLRTYYCSIVKRDRVSPLLWGPMITSLRNRRKPPPPELLQNLDNIRLSFRNPTQHPEKVYDIQEVQDLFSLCIDVVNRMVDPK